MIVYTGHHEFDFVYEDRIRGATYGQFIGTIRGCDGTWVLPENFAKGGIGPTLDSLIPIDSDGNGIDGSGVFHGTPRKSIAEITSDAADVFGEYPKNLVKPRKIVPIDGNIKTRQDFGAELRQLIRHAASDRLMRLNAHHHWDGVNSEIVLLIDRYFKEVP